MSRLTRIPLLVALFLPLPFGGCMSGPLWGADPSPARVTLPALSGADGKAVTPFADKDTKAVAIFFLSFNCPVARDYVEPMSKVADDYKAKGVRVIGVVPNGDPYEVAKQAAKFAPSFPVVADPKLAATDALAATHTPQVIVIDADKVVRYRGRVDDKYAERLKPNARVTRNDLTEALDELLAGKPVSVPETESLGCEIPRKKEKVDKLPAKVTFYKDVLPILQSRCQECHRPGEAGPFSLMTYDEAVNWAADIKGYTVARKMPPWKQTDGLEFLHDRRMPAAEIAVFAAWADGGTPAGDVKDAPPAKKFTTGWARGEPDLVLTVGEDFHLGGRGADHYRCFVLPTGLTEDKYLIGYEVRPGNAAVVHHVLNYFDTSGTARELEAAAKKASEGLKVKPADRGPGYEAEMGIGFTPKDPSQVGGFGGWAPGLRGMMTREETGFLLPKGSDVILQVHYHRDGSPTTDRTRIGLYFASKEQAAGMKRLKTLAIPGMVTPSDGYKPFTAIPPGEKAFKVAGKMVVNEDCRVYAAMPHMHMLGTKVRMTMTPPGGKEKVIVAVGEWDYAWQEVYLVKDPVDVKAGTVFTVEAEYDNSAANRLNPHSPPKEVKRGEGTTDEMLFGFLLMTSPGAGGKVDARPLTDPADYGGRTPSAPKSK